jgi:hypothetical protein
MASIPARAMTEGDHGFYAPAWNQNRALRSGFAEGKHEPFAEFAAPAPSEILSLLESQLHPQSQYENSHVAADWGM